MKVALVWALPAPLRSLTVRYERYVQGFRRLGWEVITVCLADAAPGYDEPVALAPDAAALSNPEFYRSLNCEMGVVISWLGLPDVVRAMKLAMPWVVSVSDSDGQVGERIHPGRTLRHAVYQHRYFGLQVRAVKYWLHKFLFARQSSSDMVRSADSADRITLTSPQAVEHLKRYFHAIQRTDLVEKLSHIPYPVDDDFLTTNIPTVTERANRVVAIGRWDDPQKDAELLASGMNWAAEMSPETEFLVIGRDSQMVSSRTSQVRDLGVQPPAVIADLLRTSRILLLSSRWESGPIVAFEAVSSGATVVGPAWIPACQWLTPEAGHVFTRRSASAVGAAVLQELRAWDEGSRNPCEIASRWRQWFDPAHVCQQMLPLSEKLPASSDI